MTMNKKIFLIVINILIMAVSIVFYFNNVKIVEKFVKKKVYVPQEKIIIETVNILEDSNLMQEYIIWENYKVYPKLAEEIVEMAYKYSGDYNVDALTLLFMMQVGSDFQYNAVSSSGAIGLMQINPKVWLSDENKNSLKHIGINKQKELYDPEKNIKAGAYILSIYLSQCNGEYACALKKYFDGNYKVYVDRIKYTAGNYYFFIKNKKVVDRDTN